MKHRILFFLLFLTSQLFSQTKEQIRENELLQLHQMKFTWLIEKKYDSLDVILNNRLLYVHSNGWTETKPDILADLQSGKLNYSNVKVEEAKARVFEHTGIVNGHGIFAVIMDGKPYEFTLNYTEVYINEKGKWTLVSRHANKL